MDWIQAYELEIKDSPIEIAYGFAPTGALILAKSGDINFVRFTEEELGLIQGSIVTHNHPSGSSFSEADVRFLLSNLLLELRVVTSRYRYSLLLPADPGAVFFRLKSTVDRMYEQVQTALFGAIQQGLISRAEANIQFWHQVWVEVANELNLQYQREEWQDGS